MLLHYMVQHFLQVMLNLSTIGPGCPGVLNIGTHPSLRNISCVNWLVKSVPQSLTITLGTHTFTNKSSSASHTALAVRLFSRYTDGQRVQLSTMHKQYLWPWADNGSKVPIQCHVSGLKWNLILGYGSNRHSVSGYEPSTGMTWHTPSLTFSDLASKKATWYADTSSTHQDGRHTPNHEPVSK